MSNQNLDGFLDTFEADLESALSCLQDGKLFYNKIQSLEQNLLDASPRFIAQLKKKPIDASQAKKIKEIIKLIEILELKSNAKLNWFQDLDKHLKRTLAKEI